MRRESEKNKQTGHKDIIKETFVVTNGFFVCPFCTNAVCEKGLNDRPKKCPVCGKELYY